VPALLIQFSKGNTFFHKLKPSFLKPAMSAGLRARASVLMSGVQVGLLLDPLALKNNVSIYLKIYNIRHPG